MLFSRNFRIRRPAMRGPRSRGQNLQDHTSETPARGAVVGVTGIGPVTSSLSGTRSNQLSYTPGIGPTVARSDGRSVSWSDGRAALEPLDCRTVQTLRL